MFQNSLLWNRSKTTPNRSLWNRLNKNIVWKPSLSLLTLLIPVSMCKVSCDLQNTHEKCLVCETAGVFRTTLVDPSSFNFPVQEIRSPFSGSNSITNSVDPATVIFHPDNEALELLSSACSLHVHYSQVNHILLKTRNEITFLALWFQFNIFVSIAYVQPGFFSYRDGSFFLCISVHLMKFVPTQSQPHFSSAARFDTSWSTPKLSQCSGICESAQFRDVSISSNRISKKPLSIVRRYPSTILHVLLYCSHVRSPVWAVFTKASLAAAVIVWSGCGPQHKVISSVPKHFSDF